MYKSTLRFSKTATLLIFIASIVICSRARAVQDEDMRALELVRWGMQAYSDLNMEEATSALEEALSLAPNLSQTALARIYISLGVVWSGGLADSARGQESFMIALCLDPGISIDPLVLTPELETEFKLVKNAATPEACEAKLSEVDHTGGSLVPKSSKSLVVQPEGLAFCGDHHPITEQKRKHELPFFLMLNPALSSRISTIKVMYAFDAPQNFKELPMSPMGGGYGIKLSCDEGEIRILDPGNVYYYIEARDSAGQLVCGHASATVPIQVKMTPEAQQVVPIAGMEPKECAFCEPWDIACRKKMAGSLPKLGEDCQPVPGCDEGLYCADSGLCEQSEEKTETTGTSDVPGPRFYFNALFGTGFGFTSKWSVKSVDNGYISTRDGKALAWAGMPLRLGIGFKINSKLAIEVTSRLDMAMTGAIKEPQSCASSNLTPAAEEWCSSPVHVVEGEEAITQAQDSLGTRYFNETSQFAWMINARARYTFLNDRYMALSVFGGLGYGFIRYRAASEDTGESFFPMIGLFDIELGPAMSIFFNDNIGLHFELPIDLLVGDGFALNFDFALGLGVGF